MVTQLRCCPREPLPEVFLDNILRDTAFGSPYNHGLSEPGIKEELPQLGHDKWKIFPFVGILSVFPKGWKYHQWTFPKILERGIGNVWVHLFNLQGRMTFRGMTSHTPHSPQSTLGVITTLCPAVLFSTFADLFLFLLPPLSSQISWPHA